MHNHATYITHTHTLVAYLREGSGPQHHAVVVAVTAHRQVLIGQDDVPVCRGGVEGEPSHCRKETSDCRLIFLLKAVCAQKRSVHEEQIQAGVHLVYLRWLFNAEANPLIHP